MSGTHFKIAVKHIQLLKSLGVFTILLLGLCMPAQADVNSQVQAAFLNLPLSFESNLGQIDSQVMFSARVPGYKLFLRPNLRVLTLSTSETRSVLRMRLMDGNPSHTVRGLQQLPGKSNYFIINGPKNWHTDMPYYISLGQVPGVFFGRELITTKIISRG